MSGCGGQIAVQGNLTILSVSASQDSKLTNWYFIITWSFIVSWRQMYPVFFRLLYVMDFFFFFHFGEKKKLSGKLNEHKQTFVSESQGNVRELWLKEYAHFSMRGCAQYSFACVTDSALPHTAQTLTQTYSIIFQSRLLSLEVLYCILNTLYMRHSHLPSWYKTLHFQCFVSFFLPFFPSSLHSVVEHWPTKCSPNWLL